MTWSSGAARVGLPPMAIAPTDTVATARFPDVQDALLACSCSFADYHFPGGACRGPGTAPRHVGFMAALSLTAVPPAAVALTLAALKGLQSFISLINEPGGRKDPSPIQARERTDRGRGDELLRGTADAPARNGSLRRLRGHTTPAAIATPKANPVRSTPSPPTEPSWNRHDQACQPRGRAGGKHCGSLWPPGARGTLSARVRATR